MSSAGMPGRGRRHDRRRDRAWIPLAAILLGLCTWSGASAAGAEVSPSATAGCSSSASSGAVTLPSGATLCDHVAAADGGMTIQLTKTVGTDPNTCASTNEITVSSATKTVIYCYAVQNTGTLTATTHDLVDDHLGQLLSGYSYSLASGASTFATAAADIEGDGPVIVNIATWTASNGTNSDDSTAQAKVTIVDGPTAPTPVAATAGEGTAHLTWTVPTSTGGHPITGYRITPIDNGVAQTPIATGSGVLVYDFTGLTNGHTYRFDVAATTDIGDGATGQSNQVVPQWWRPWTSATKAVTEIYTWLTGKAPTTAQRDAFIASANSSGKLPGDLVSALRDGADATTNVDPVIRLYSAYFLRPPDRGGLAFWLNRRRSGWTLSRISDNFAGSSEFENRYGSLSNADYVNLVYDNVLDRDPDAAGLSYWTGQLDAKKKSRGQVMLNFSDSNEYKTKRANYVDAVSLSIQFLGLSPTKAEITAFTTQFETKTVAAITRELIHAPSFDARAG